MTTTMMMMVTHLWKVSDNRKYTICIESSNNDKKMKVRSKIPMVMGTGMWHQVVWWTGTNISRETCCLHLPSIPEDGDSRFLQNVGTNVQDYVAPTFQKNVILKMRRPWIHTNTKRTTHNMKTVPENTKKKTPKVGLCNLQLMWCSPLACEWTKRN